MCVPGLKVVVGCCGRGGVGTEAYLSMFGALEVQSTFYRLPRPDTPLRWRRRCGDKFVFTMKAYQGLTHRWDSPTWGRHPKPSGDPEKYGGLKPTEENFKLWEKTVEVAKGMDSEVVVIQLPPSFKASAENLGNLAAFLGSVELPVTVGVEFRHPSWWSYSDDVRSLFNRYAVTQVVDPLTAKAFVHSGTAYFRLHGKGGYRYEYSRSELEQLRDLVQEGRYESRYVFFNNTAMVRDASAFSRMVHASE